MLQYFSYTETKKIKKLGHDASEKFKLEQHKSLIDLWIVFEKIFSLK